MNQTESVHHFVYDCTAYEELREECFPEGMEHDLRLLLGHPQHTSQIVEFAAASGCLRQFRNIFNTVEDNGGLQQ